MIIIAGLLVIGLAFMVIGQINNAEIILSPIIGMMFGFLYNKEQLDEGYEITLQCLIGVVSITVIWTNNQTGLEL